MNRDRIGRIKIESMPSIAMKTMKYYLILLLVLLVTNFSFSTTNNHFCQNHTEFQNFDSTSKCVFNHSANLIFNNPDNPMSIDIGDSGEECVDEDFSNDCPLKLNRQIQEFLPVSDFDEKISTKTETSSSHSSIPLFILYHSWKDNLS